MAQEQQPRTGGGWLSFTALFTDGDRDQRQASSPAASHAVPSLPPPPNAQEVPDNEVASTPDDAVANFQTEELADMRLDIQEIQEAIKNHDLWVQDAVAMRNDIDDLQRAIGEHEGWMQNLSSVVKQIQANLKEVNTLVFGTSDKEVGLEKGYFPSKGPSTEGDLSGALKTHTAPADAQFGGEYERTTNGVNGDASEGETEMHILVVDLNKQLNSGLRMLRTMVTAVEGTLSRQVDAERTSRRSSVAELRGEIARLRDDMGFAAAAQVQPGSASSDAATRNSNASLGVLQAAVDGLDQRLAIRAADLDRMVLELRTELAALRTEQQLQAVAASALALSQGGCSTKARHEILSKLGHERSQGSRPATAERSVHGGDAKRAYSAPPAEREERKEFRERDTFRETTKVFLNSTSGQPSPIRYAVAAAQRGGWNAGGGGPGPRDRDHHSGNPPDRPQGSKVAPMSVWHC